MPAGYPHRNLQWEFIHHWRTTRSYRKVSPSAGSYPQWPKYMMNRNRARTPGRQQVSWNSRKRHLLRLWTIRKEPEMTQGTPNPRVNIKGGFFPSRRHQEGCWIGDPGRLLPERRTYRHQATVDQGLFTREGTLGPRDAGVVPPKEEHLQTRCQGHRLKGALVT